MRYKTFKKKLLKEDPEFRKEYYKKDLKFELSSILQEARIRKGFTRQEFAKKMKVDKKTISRIERGKIGLMKN